MNHPRKLSITFKFVFLPALALALGLGAAGLLLSQAQSARAGAPDGTQVWDAASFDLGSAHACALTPSGGVKCWGGNWDGQLGDGTTNDSPTPVNVSGLTSGIAAVSTGNYFSCARASSGGVRCWGYNEEGELGNGTITGTLTPVQVSGLTSGVAAIAGGAYHTCALLGAGSATGGTVQCWGSNYAGGLGDGTTTDHWTPAVVTDTGSHSPLSGVLAISAGSYHTCALLGAGSATGGTVKCWGGNWDGQLGDGTTTDSPTPVEVPGLTGVTAVSAGDSHTCAVISGGGVKCWGANSDGQLGDGTTDTRYNPVVVTDTLSGSPLSGIVAVSAGERHTCAVTSDGKVKCWGANYDGQLGDGTLANNRLTPVEVTGLADAASVSAGTSTTCARLTGGGIKCWGYNDCGQLGNGIPSYRSTPVDVLGASSDVSAIEAGDNFTCAVINGEVKCWGVNEHGQLGDNSMTDSATPVAVTGLDSGITNLAAGDQHACAVNSDGGLKCWGYDWRGQLGDGNTDTESLIPVQVTGLTSGVAQVGAGVMLSCARTTGGRVQCWGYNDAGQMGNGTSGPDEPWPLTVTVAYGGDPLSGVSAISVGGFHVCALISGKVECWGQDDYGQLGVSTAPDICSYGDPCIISPVTVTVSGGLPLSGVSAIAAGEYHTCALMTDHTVRCWGNNEYGQLGNSAVMDTCVSYGETYPCSKTPVVVTDTLSHSALTGVVAIAAGSDHTCALMSTGGVKCWGDNYYGELGDGTTNDSSTPVDVAGLTNAAAISAGELHTCSLTTTGGAKCWGYNYDGALGNGEVGYATVPVDVVDLNYWPIFIPILMKH